MLYQSECFQHQTFVCGGAPGITVTLFVSCVMCVCVCAHSTWWKNVRGGVWSLLSVEGVDYCWLRTAWYSCYCWHFNEYLLKKEINKHIKDSHLFRYFFSCTFTRPWGHECTMSHILYFCYTLQKTRTEVFPWHRCPLSITVTMI